MVSRDAEPTDAGDEKQVRERKTKAKLQRQAEMLRFAKLLGTYEGREFVWRLMTQAGLFGTSFVGELPLSMAYNEGKRSQALWVQVDIFEADPKAWALMQREAEDREKGLA